MSDSSEQPQGAGDAGDVSDPRRTTAVPFIAAVAVIAVVVLAIVVASWLSPADENVTEADLINRALADFVQAHNHDDPDLRETLVCPSFSEEKSVLAGREGEVALDGVESVVVDGDRAHADATISTEDAKGTTTDTWQLTRSGDKWVVCN